MPGAVRGQIYVRNSSKMLTYGCCIRYRTRGGRGRMFPFPFLSATITDEQKSNSVLKKGELHTFDGDTRCLT